VLVKELQSLGLAVEVINEEEKTIQAERIDESSEIENGPEIIEVMPALEKNSEDEEVKKDQKIEDKEAEEGKEVEDKPAGEIPEAEDKNKPVDTLPDAKNDLEEEGVEKDSA